MAYVYKIVGGNCKHNCTTIFAHVCCSSNGNLTVSKLSLALKCPPSPLTSVTWHVSMDILSQGRENIYDLTLGNPPLHLLWCLWLLFNIFKAPSPESKEAEYPLGNQHLSIGSTFPSLNGMGSIIQQSVVCQDISIGITDITD